MKPSMYPTVAIGPPRPLMNPAPQGTKHCQRYRPLAGVRNVNEIVSWALLREHGAFEHRFLALAPGPISGTERPISGIANRCEAVSGSIDLVGLPSSKMVPPTVPWTCPRKLLRSPVCVSYS